jgi:hypothetical protein
MTTDQVLQESSANIIKKWLFVVPLAAFVASYLAVLDVFHFMPVALDNHPKQSKFENPASGVDLEPVLPAALLYIITPCSRPRNLLDIRKSFNDTYNWVWIIVYFSKPSHHAFPGANNIYEVWLGTEGSYPDEPSTTGNVLRNFGISLVKGDSAYIYFLDDDNIMHPRFWELVYPILDEGKNDFVTFDQRRTTKEVLLGPRAEVWKIDTGMFVTRQSLINESRWRIARYDADGYFATEIQAKALHHLYINQTCAYYNFLKQDLLGAGVGKTVIRFLKNLL